MEDLKKYTILVVDDDADLREALVFDVKRKGFTVLSADSGVRAFEIVQKQKVHLVLSDMRMPGGDGLSFLEKIRKLDPTIPVVIFITGFSDASEEECIQKGAKKVFTKPFDREALMRSVFEVLDIK